MNPRARPRRPPVVLSNRLPFSGRNFRATGWASLRSSGDRTARASVKGIRGTSSPVPVRDEGGPVEGTRAPLHLPAVL
jgi:hypothetical protein